MRKIKLIIAAIAFTGTIFSACKDEKPEILYWNDPATSSDTLYQNPVFEPDLADPTIIRAGDGYFYAYGTENLWAEGLPRIAPIVRSKNLIKWEYVSDAFLTKPTWKSSGGIWAPQIIFQAQEGKYYLYYSFSLWNDGNPGIGIAESVHPYGPFTDKGKVLDTQSTGVGNSIDQFYIEVGTGRNRKKYLFWGSYRGIYGIEIADDMKTTIGDKFKIAGDGFEATYIYPKDGKFYFFGSSGSCCEGLDTKYRVSVAVANDIKGPYLTKTGAEIISNGREGTPFLVGDASTGWIGPGHNGEIFTDDLGHDYILYHAVDVKKPYLPGGATRRPLMLDEIIWVDGWPTIEGGVPSSTLKRAPYFE